MNDTRTAIRAFSNTIAYHICDAGFIVGIVGTFTNTPPFDDLHVQTFEKAIEYIQTYLEENPFDDCSFLENFPADSNLCFVMLCRNFYGDLAIDHHEIIISEADHD